MTYRYVVEAQRSQGRWAGRWYPVGWATSQGKAIGLAREWASAHYEWARVVRWALPGYSRETVYSTGPAGRG